MGLWTLYVIPLHAITSRNTVGEEATSAARTVITFIWLATNIAYTKLTIFVLKYE